MNSMLTSATRALRSIRQQWAESPVLRIGTWAIVGVLWLNALWWHQDQLAIGLKDVASLESEISSLRSLTSGPGWAVRANDATTQLEALQRMAWTETTPGLAQAAFQDWLTQACAKLGLPLKELRLGESTVGGLVQRGASARADVRGASELAPATGGTVLPLAEVQARLILEFKPQAMASLLTEISANPQYVMIDRFQLRTWLQPAQAELDVRIETRLRSKTP